MLSRVANELYWTGRHFERAENTARILDVTYRNSLLPYQLGEPGLAWAAQGALLATTSYPDRTSPVLRGKFLLNNIFGLQTTPPPAGVSHRTDTPGAAHPSAASAPAPPR